MRRRRRTVLSRTGRAAPVAAVCRIYCGFGGGLCGLRVGRGGVVGTKRRGTPAGRVAPPPPKACRRRTRGPVACHWRRIGQAHAFIQALPREEGSCAAAAPRDSKSDSDFRRRMRGAMGHHGTAPEGTVRTRAWGGRRHPIPRAESGVGGVDAPHIMAAPATRWPRRLRVACGKRDPSGPSVCMSCPTYRPRMPCPTCMACPTVCGQPRRPAHVD
jgi:hypothetical protein